MEAQEDRPMIRSQPHLDCYLCGAQGKSLYQGLNDRLFGAPGQWNTKQCPNPDCGLLWLDPMPIEDDIGQAYRTYFTHRQTARAADRPRRGRFRRVKLFYREARKEGYLANKYGYQSDTLASWKKGLGMLMYLHPRRRADLDGRVMYLPAKPDGRLLEVGCGSGRMLKFMQQLGWQVEGIDVDPGGVESAKSKGLPVTLGDLEAQQYPHDHCDAIIMSHLIEHVHDPLQLLRECHRILKPHARLVIVTPNSQSWGHRIFQNNWLALDPPRHLYIFAGKSLHKLADEAGFHGLELSTTSRGAKDLFMASRAIQRTGHHVWGTRQPRAVRAWARRMQLIEWAMLKLKPDVGEEIVLMARK